MGNQKGMTLVELVFAAGIMALTVLSSFYVLVEAHHLSEESRTRLLALNAARSVVEAVKNTPLANVPAISTATYVPATLPGGTITIATNPATLTNVSVATVTITVNYRGTKNAQRSLQVSTMRSRY